MVRRGGRIGKKRNLRAAMVKVVGADLEDVKNNCAKEINAVVLYNKTFVSLTVLEIMVDSAAEESCMPEGVERVGQGVRDAGAIEVAEVHECERWDNGPLWGEGDDVPGGCAER